MRIEFLLDYIQSEDCKIDNKKKIIEAIIHEEWEITDVNIYPNVNGGGAVVELKSESGCWLSNIPAWLFNERMLLDEYKRLKAKEPAKPKKPKEVMKCKKFQPICTTVEQSKMLLELGVPADSADCAYRGSNMPIDILPLNISYIEYEKEIHNLETKKDIQNGFFQTCEPCWSVTRLIDIYKTCRTYNCNSFSFPTQYSLDNMLEYVLALFNENKDRLNFEFLNEVF